MTRSGLSGLADVHTEAEAALAQLDQRYTPSRRELVEVLARADRPLTIADILSRRRGMAQSSAYRNLAVLEQAEVVHRVLGADEFARYELAEQLSHHHHHLVCVTCGRVADFRVGPELERAVANAAAAAADAAGFSATSHRLDLVGQCADCQP